MTYVYSLTRLLEEAAYVDSPTRKAIGSFRSVTELLESAVALQSQHAGLFAFLAFHPVQDHAISDYIQNGSIGSDSGVRLLVLLFASRECDLIEELTPSLLVGNVAVNYAVNPASELVEMIFSDGPVPVLPGLMFFR